MKLCCIEKNKKKKRSKINKILSKKKRQLHFLILLTLYVLEVSFNSKIQRPGNIGGRCHPEREKLGPCYPVSYTIAINGTVR